MLRGVFGDYQQMKYMPHEWRRKRTIESWVGYAIRRAWGFLFYTHIYMFLQNILAWMDRSFSESFALESWCDGPPSGYHKETYFSSFGSKIGIVNAYGEIHTVVGYLAVRHYYDGSELIQRVAVRRNLERGERLATKAEILAYQEKIMAEWDGLTVA